MSKEKSFKKIRVKPYHVDDNILYAFSKLSIEKNNVPNSFSKDVKHIEDQHCKNTCVQTSFSFKKFIPDESKKEYTQVLYIATSKNYAKNDRFKIGGVSSVKQLKKRLSCYNTRSASGDEWYYCDFFNVTNFRHVESRLKEIIGRFRDKKNKEIYVLNYHDLKYMVNTICLNFKNETELAYINMPGFVTNLEHSTFIPPEINVSIFYFTKT